MPWQEISPSPSFSLPSFSILPFPPLSPTPLSLSLFLFKLALCYFARTRLGVPAAWKDGRLGLVHLLANFCAAPSNTNEARKLHGTARHTAQPPARPRTRGVRCVCGKRELHSASQMRRLLSLGNFSGTLANSYLTRIRSSSCRRVSPTAVYAIQNLLLR